MNHEFKDLSSYEFEMIQGGRVRGVGSGCHIGGLM